MSDNIAQLQERIAALEAAVGPAPFAVGDLPPHVASGELITSAWGNAVVDELARKRGEIEVAFVFDIGNKTTGVWTVGSVTPSPNPTAFARRVTAWASVEFSASSDAAVIGIIRPTISGSVGERQSQQTKADAGFWAPIPLSFTWTVAAGADASFTVVATVGSSNASLKCHGTYRVQKLADT